MDDIKNVIRYAINTEGNRFAIPFPCINDHRPSTYGEEGKWFCTECWINMKEKK